MSHTQLRRCVIIWNRILNFSTPWTHKHHFTFPKFSYTHSTAHHTIPGQPELHHVECAGSSKQSPSHQLLDQWPYMYTSHTCPDGNTSTAKRKPLAFYCSMHTWSNLVHFVTFPTELVDKHTARPRQCPNLALNLCTASQKGPCRIYSRYPLRLDQATPCTPLPDPT